MHNSSLKNSPPKKKNKCSRHRNNIIIVAHPFCACWVIGRVLSKQAADSREELFPSCLQMTLADASTFLPACHVSFVGRCRGKLVLWKLLFILIFFFTPHSSYTKITLMIHTGCEVLSWGEVKIRSCHTEYLIWYDYVALCKIKFILYYGCWVYLFINWKKITNYSICVLSQCEIHKLCFHLL